MTKTVVLKATNYQGTPVATDVVLEGVAGVAATGRHIVIKADEQFDENSFDNPRMIVPAELPLAACAPKFSVTLPPFSVNVLRIPVDRQVMPRIVQSSL